MSRSETPSSGCGRAATFGIRSRAEVMDWVKLSRRFVIEVGTAIWGGDAEIRSSRRGAEKEVDGEKNEKKMIKKKE